MKNLTAIEKERVREVSKLLREQFPDLVDGGAQMLAELYVTDCEGFQEFIRGFMEKQNVTYMHEENQTTTDRPQHDDEQQRVLEC
jgi:hypothetical protein